MEPEYKANTKFGDRYHYGRFSNIDSHSTIPTFDTLCDEQIILGDIDQVVQMSKDVNNCKNCALILSARRIEDAGNVLRHLAIHSHDIGYCRHGNYVGGSGVDHLCGQCESMSLDQEVDEIMDLVENEMRAIRDWCEDYRGVTA